MRFERLQELDDFLTSVFPDLSVEQNLRLGGYLMRRSSETNRAVASLSADERGLLEITRALMMDPQLLLRDEPSIRL